MHYDSHINRVTLFTLQAAHPFCISLFINFAARSMTQNVREKRCLSRNKRINNDRMCDYIYTFLIIPKQPK